MKIAYCLHGCIGGLTGKSGEKTCGSEQVHDIVSNNNESFFKDQEFDFFIHSWDTHLKSEYINTYDPKEYIIEPQIEFSHPKLPKNNRVFGHLSRWYSAREVLELKSKFEEKNNFKYDLVILTRLDIYWLKQIIFENLNASHFNFDQIKVHNKFYGTKTSPEVGDRMIISNSENMNLLKNMYNELPLIVESNPNQYGGISSHYSLSILLKKYKMRENVSFPYNYWITNHKEHISNANFSILRYLINHPQDLIKIKI
jgi:hypothetical protein